MKFGEVLRSLDWVSAAIMVLLMTLGLAMLVSATYTQGILSGLFIRQFISAAIAITLFFALAALPYHALKRYALLLYTAGLAGLVTVALFGALVRGTVSRLVIFGVQVQPSEFMKVGLVVFLAWLLSRSKNMSWKTIVVSGVAAGLPALLIMLEPDLGVAALLVLLWAVVLVFKGISGKHIAALTLAGLVVFAASWQWLFVDYQRERLLTFLDPARDPLGAGYNIVQSIVALGSGQLTGRGLGHGPQSQLKFLPERHTDFILSSIGEELGFLGVGLLIALYFVLLWRILKIARSTRDPFGQLMSVGVFIILLVSFSVSAGMNMGLLPVTGIPLPLVSFGGSNLVTTCALLGIVQSVRLHSKWTRTSLAEISHF